MPLAFFCTLFFRHRKKSVSAPWDGQSQSAPESARQAPTRESLCGASRGLSSGQTIGAARTAVRSACCLPELRVANRLRRLCPLGTRFPTFPPCTPFGSLTEAIERPIGLQALFPRRSRRVIPRRGRGLRLRAHWGLSARPQSPSGRVGEKTQGHAFLRKTQRAFLGANNRRGSHCRAARLLFVCTCAARTRR